MGVVGRHKTARRFGASKDVVLGHQLIDLEAGRRTERVPMGAGSEVDAIAANLKTDGGALGPPPVLTESPKKDSGDQGNGRVRSAQPPT